MNERTTLEIIAPTVEEALTQGLAQLNLTADKVSVEVLDAGNKGLFGFGKAQVRVRLTVLPEGGGAAAVAAEPVVREPKAKKKSAPTQPKTEPVQESSPLPAHDALLDHTEAVISKLIHLLHLEAQVSAHYEGDQQPGRRNIHVDLRGKDLSILIGRHSETLNAFQNVASLIVGKEEQDWVRLSIDVEGYRDRRKNQLVQMALRMADQVAKNGRKQSLEPMPAGERRIIHIALRDHPDVITESSGEEPHRKVMIVPKNS